MGEYVCVQPSTTSYLLPTDLPGLDLLKAEVERQETVAIALCPCDADYVEVSLKGIWLASVPESAEGIFVTTLSHSTEFFLLKL